MHLRDFLAQRAADDSDAEGIGFERRFFFLPHALGARICVAIMAINAMVDFMMHTARGEAWISQREAIPAAHMVVRAGERLIVATIVFDERHQRRPVGFRGLLEQRPRRGVGRKRRIARREVTPARDNFIQRGDECRVI